MESFQVAPGKEDTPPLPPRKHSMVSLESHASQGIPKEYLDESLRQLGNSIVRENNSLVERVLQGNPPSLRTDSGQEPNVALEEQNGKLSAEKATVDEQLNNTNAQLTTSRRELLEARATVRKLTDNNTKYREIILKGSSDNKEIPDAEIHSRFVGLRDIVQRIIHKHYSAQGQIKLSKTNNPYFEDQKLFREELASLSEPLQRFAMRAKVFDILDDRLISARTFGIGDYEKSLMRFERALNSSKSVSQIDLADWRSRTIECGAWLEEKSQWPGDTCHEILERMDPHLSVVTSSSAVLKEQLIKSMRDLCDRAYDLSIMMRKSKKAGFATSTMKKDTIVTTAWETKFSCQAYDGPLHSDILGSRVSIIVFDGLVKLGDNPSEEPVTLEKPHVVCLKR
ncbi:MAG: hypothetical protein Q9222_007074 [Ikaeria aurantiellina]